MAVKSNLKNMALCLFAICFVCSALLAGVYAVTAEPIAKAEKIQLENSIKAVLPEGGELSTVKTVDAGGSTYEYYESVEAGTPAAYAIKSTVVGFGGPLSIMVGIKADGTIYNTSVLSHSETPGLGAKCDEKGSGFRAQFQGFDPSTKKLAVKKDQGDVDAITASTITSRAYTKAIANAVEAFNTITK